MSHIIAAGSTRPSKGFWWHVGWISGAIGISLIYGPIIWLMVMSVSAEPLSGLPGPFTVIWYQKLFSNASWLVPLEISVVTGLVVGLITLALGTLVGRAIPRLHRWSLVILVLSLLPLLVPGVVSGTAEFLYLRSFLGLPMGAWSMTLGHVIWAFPFCLLAILVVSVRFDTRLLEAASDLGATSWKRFWSIEVPLLLPGMVSAALFGFLLSFNELERTIYLRGRTETLPIYLWQQAATHSSNVPLIYALNVIILLASAAIVGVAFWFLFAEKK